MDLGRSISSMATLLQEFKNDYTDLSARQNTSKCRMTPNRISMFLSTLTYMQHLIILTMKTRDTVTLLAMLEITGAYTGKA